MSQQLVSRLINFDMDVRKKQGGTVTEGKCTVIIKVTIEQFLLIFNCVIEVNQDNPLFAIIFMSVLDYWNILCVFVKDCMSFLFK